MAIPIFGAMFIPVALFVFFLRPQYLVSLMIVASVFAGASVLDLSLGDSVFGLQPYYFVAALLAVRAVPFLLAHRHAGHCLEPALHRIQTSLVYFWIWATASAFLFPVIFSGVRVIDPRLGIEDVLAAMGLEGEGSPLHWSLGNLGQAVYMSLSLIALLYVLKCADHGNSRQALKALRAALMIVAVIALLQSLAAWRGWDFPYDFFNNNPAYAQNYDASFEDIRRVNATFTEASYAGGFLAAGALGLLATRLSGGPGNIIMIFAVIVGLILTTATTGYAAFLIGGVLLFFYLRRGSERKKSSRNIVWKSILAALLVTGIMVGLLIAVPPLRRAVLETTVNKVDTISFGARAALDAYTIRLLFETYGVGVGLGSNRPATLGAYLLGNIGVIGTVLFVLYISRLFSRLVRVSRRPGADSYVMVTWMLAGILIAQMIALPDLSWPPLWALLILATGMLASQSATSSSTRKVSVVAPVKHPPSANPEPA
jgi:hypothetical protein